MKIKLTKTRVETLIVDLDKERKHFEKHFKGKQFKRLWAVIQAAIDNQWELVDRLYLDLPRCKKEECSEAEFLPLWLSGDFRSCFNQAGDHQVDTRYEAEMIEHVS